MAELGLWRYDVIIRTRTWSGIYSGEGTPTDVDVLVAPRPRVKVLTTQDVASSGGTYREGDFRVDLITPRSPAGTGYTPAQLNLRPSGINQDVTVILSGDEGTIECQIVEFRFDDPFNYVLVVRETRTAVGTTRG